jgi:hypothetical protein
VRRAPPPAGVCEAPITCTLNSECPPAQVCGADEVCRNACKTSRDCITGQACVSQTCVDPASVKDGGADAAETSVDAGGGVPCVHGSDCPASGIDTVTVTDANDDVAKSQVVVVTQAVKLVPAVSSTFDGTCLPDRRSLSMLVRMSAKKTPKTTNPLSTKAKLPSSDAPVKGASAPVSTTAATAIATALSHIAAARSALETIGLVSLTTAERKDSNGKLRNGEPAAMLNVLATVDAFTNLFASIADKDGGVDDTLVETAPARADLATWTALAPVSAAIEALHSAVSDTMLLAAQEANEVVGAAYPILRINANSNPKLAKAGAVAIAFYGHAAKQRAANKAKAARAAKAAAKANKATAS